MIKTIDTTKVVKTRDGRKVKILSGDSGIPGYPIVGVVAEGTDQVLTVHSYTREGKLHHRLRGEDGSNLVNVSETISRTFWLNIYPPFMNCTHPGEPEGLNVFFSEEDAHTYFCSNRVACVKVSFVEGDGL
jgi:hypothetical protein